MSKDRLAAMYRAVARTPINLYGNHPWSMWDPQRTIGSLRKIAITLPQTVQQINTAMLSRHNHQLQHNLLPSTTLLNNPILNHRVAVVTDLLNRAGIDPTVSEDDIMSAKTLGYVSLLSRPNYIRDAKIRGVVIDLNDGHHPCVTRSFAAVRDVVFCFQCLTTPRTGPRKTCQIAIAYDLEVAKSEVPFKL